MAKIVKFDSEARSAMLKGVDILANRNRARRQIWKYGSSNG